MNKDHLTGAFTQAELKPRLRMELERAAKASLPLSLLIIDLDHFKSVNDGFGHTRGDQLLSDLAQRIRGELRDTDLLFRYGGDEFVLLLPHTPREKATALAHRLVDQIGQTPFAGEPPISLSVSIGQVTFPEDAATPAELFEEADMRLYEAKRAGRGRAVSQKPQGWLGLRFEEKGRLIEREDATRTLNLFLESVKSGDRGVLAVCGPRGSGRSRFLAEVAGKASQQGFSVIELDCTPASKQRPGFALAEALNTKDPKLDVNPDHLLEQLREQLDKESRILVTIDNINHLDFDTLSVFRRFLATDEGKSVVVVYTVDQKTSRRVFLHATKHETMELDPLSKDGLKVWLRTLMAWEPNDDFLSWLHAETSGLPGLIKRGLEYLLRREMLTRIDDEWIPGDDLLSFKLASHIGPLSTPVIRNLPEVLTNFVGREPEIEKGKELLERNRLLTIMGPGGIGKTRLALQIAAEVSEKYADGVYFASMMTAQSVEFLISTIADALGFSFFGNKSPVEQLADYLQHKEALILLDSFEHLVQDAEILVGLLREAAGLRFLVTSRQILNLQAEAVLELGPMEVPSEEFPKDIEEYSAAQLFIDKARRVRPGFVIPSQDTRFVGRICRLVEGMPLGIELAASWVRSLTVREIAAEIDRGYDFLTSSLRDVPRRHRSLRLVFDYSWELLGPKERDVFIKLSVFRGGFTRHAAETIAGASLPLLSLLIDKSLIWRDSSGRYHMLELLRRYAGDKLEEDPGLNIRTRDRHALYQGNFMCQREQNLTGARQKQALEEIREEIENVRAGFRWAVTQQDLKVTDIYLESLSLFYEQQGRFAEGKELFAWASAELEQSKGLVPAKIEAFKAAFTYRLGNYQEGRSLLEEILPEFQRLGAKKETIFVLSALGSICHRLGEYDKSREFITKSLDLSREIGDEVNIGNSLSGLASVATNLGEYEEARTMSEESLQVHRKLSNYRGMARTLNNLGNALVAMGDYDGANRCYAESLSVYKELGHRWGMDIVLGNMSEAALFKKEYERASQLLSQALDISREVGDREGIAFCLNHMGNVAFSQKNYGEARRYHEEGLEISQGMDNPWVKSSSLKGLGMIARTLGKHEEAESYLREALELATIIRRVMDETDIIVETARLLADRDNPHRALELLAVVIENPGTEKETKDKAHDLLDGLKVKMSSEEFEALLKKGKARKLEEVVKEILTQT